MQVYVTGKQPKFQYITIGFLSRMNPFLNNTVIGFGWFGSVYSFKGSLYFFNLKIYRLGQEVKSPEFQPQYYQSQQAHQKQKSL
jgi:hypothetical protein